MPKRYYLKEKRINKRGKSFWRSRATKKFAKAPKAGETYSYTNDKKGRRRFRDIKGRYTKTPEDMVRNTWGTGISDKNKAYSFTFYTFSAKDLDSNERDLCVKKFRECLGKWLESHYQSKGYTYDKDWWGKEIVRDEENESVPFYPEFFEKWSFEVNQTEERSGSLSDIL
jgi:hypothetical protein